MKRMKIAVIMLVLSLLTVACDSGDSGKELVHQNLPGLQKYDSSPITVTMYCPYPQTLFMKSFRENQQAMDHAALRTKEALNMNLFIEKIMPGSSSLDVTRTIGPYRINEFDAMVVYGDIYPLINKDAVMDVTELFKKYAPNYYNQFTPEELDQVTYDGKIMAIPNHSSASKRISVAVRADLLEKLGIESIKNFDEYESFLEAVEAINPDFLSTSIINPSKISMEYYGYASLPGGMVYKWDDIEYKVFPWEKTNAFQKALNLQYEWINKGYFNKMWNTTDIWPRYFIYYMEDLINSINTGKVASFISDWDTAVVTTRIINGKHDYKIFPLNMDKAAFETSRNEPVIVIGKNTRNAEKILQFIDWVHSSQRNYDLFMYGVEGENYTLENNMVKLPDKASMIQYNWYGSEAFRNDKYERQFISDLKSNITGYSGENDINLIPLPTASFMPHIDNLAKIIEHRDGLLGLVLLNTIRFNTSLEEGYNMTLDESKRRLEGVSTNSIVAEMQELLNEWKITSH